MSEIIFSQWLLILYLITFRMLLLNLVCSWQFMKADKENYDGLVERKENLFLFCHILTNFFCKIIMNGSGEIFCPWGCLGWGWAGYPASCAQPLTPQQILINVVKLRYTQPRSSYLCSNTRLFQQYYIQLVHNCQFDNLFKQSGFIVNFSDDLSALLLSSLGFHNHHNRTTFHSHAFPPCVSQVLSMNSG